MMDVLLSLILLTFLRVAMPYPSGPPVGTNNICFTMEPGHNSSSQPLGHCPYEILTNTDGCFRDGLDIQVVVRTKKEYYVDMKGLFVQAREVDASASFGTFSVNDPKLQTLICEANEDSAAGHREPVHTDFVEMIWTAPKPQPSTDPEPDVKIRATIVKNVYTYWNGVESRPLAYKRTCSLLPKIEPWRRYEFTSARASSSLTTYVTSMFVLILTTFMNL